ncbi:MAG: formylglycine-generating enzyme family protein [Planctomycetota bacterium]
MAAAAGVAASCGKARTQPTNRPAPSLGSGIVLELAIVPAGQFLMGSPSSESGRVNNEGPQHCVVITRPFYMGKYEVTQAQYEHVMGKNTSHFTGQQNPVEMVSWDEASAFCQALSQRTGQVVRLPTEAEWEYACRAGSKTRFCYGDSDGVLLQYAWWVRNSGRMTHAVGGKQGNAWGLHDMHGNVWEWCADREGAYSSGTTSDPPGPVGGSARVIRGGCWSNISRSCRSACRRWAPQDGCFDRVGFRVVVMPPVADARLEIP